jgi:ribonuclease J
VDHSAFDALAFSIEYEGKRILYTGDFRAHGRKGWTIDRLLTDVPKGIDALLMEGTTIGRTNGATLTEEDVANQAETLCKTSNEPVLVCQSGQNVDRWCSFFRAAKRTNRLFIVDPYVAHIMDEIAAINGNTIPSAYKNKGTVRVYYPHYIKQKEIAYRYKPLKIEADEIARERHRIVMLVRTGMEKYLKKLHGNDEALHGGMLLYLMWSGYKKKTNTKAFLDYIEKCGMSIQDLHSSGHADVDTLKKLASTLQPKTLIPIHTFHPDRYEMFGCEVRALQDGESHLV